MEQQETPQDAKIIQELLGSMDHDPRVVEQLMEFMYRYTAEVLQDSEAISSRSGLPVGETSAQDVMLAIQTRAQHAFVPPPPQQLLLSLSALRNKDLLPELRSRHGLRIPPERECLLNPNFQLQPSQPDPPVPAAAVDAAALEARRQSDYNVKRKHIDAMSVETPGEGWQPAPEAAAEPWPGSGGGDDVEEFM